MLLEARHEDGSPMTDAELRDELMTLLVAGHETTATALAWALERLARHPARVGAAARAGDEDYLDAVIKETLRLRPVLPIVAAAAQGAVRDRRLRAARGRPVVPCIYLMHRRPDVYPDPLAFRPERFLEQPAGTYTWIPFGGGVRRCLGASFAQFEMETVLRVLARARAAGARPRPERDPRRDHARAGRDGRVLVARRAAPVRPAQPVPSVAEQGARQPRAALGTASAAPDAHPLAHRRAAEVQGQLGVDEPLGGHLEHVERRCPSPPPEQALARRHLLARHQRDPHAGPTRAPGRGPGSRRVPSATRPRRRSRSPGRVAGRHVRSGPRRWCRPLGLGRAGAAPPRPGAHDARPSGPSVASSSSTDRPGPLHRRGRR